MSIVTLLVVLAMVGLATLVVCRAIARPDQRMQMFNVEDVVYWAVEHGKIDELRDALDMAENLAGTNRRPARWP